MADDVHMPNEDQPDTEITSACTQNLDSTKEMYPMNSTRVLPQVENIDAINDGNVCKKDCAISGMVQSSILVVTPNDGLQQVEMGGLFP